MTSCMNPLRSFVALLVVTPLAAVAGTVSLTLDDFTATNGGAPAEAWSTLEDGVIHLRGKGGGNLISKEEYTDFELDWEWKVAPKGNNGVKYWVTKVGGREWLGIEYQMIDDSGHPDGLRGGSHGTAAFYDIKETVPDKAVKPAGEWNHSKIVVRDGKVQHWLNGSLAAEADTTTEEWKQLIAASKFKNKEGFAPGKGRIMLTEHSDETWYRNIRITVP